MTSGNLRWYKDLARDGATNFAPNNGVVIATGWDMFNRVINGGNGVLYAIDAIGNLHWYKDTHRDGTPMTAGHHSLDAPNEGATIGTGWGSFTQVFSGGNGVLYAIDRDGNLRWYKDTHRDGTPVTAGGAPSFDASNNGAVIGIGWNMFTTVFSTGNGVIFGRDTAGHLWWYKDLAQDGTPSGLPAAERPSARDFDSTVIPRPLFRRGQCRRRRRDLRHRQQRRTPLLQSAGARWLDPDAQQVTASVRQAAPGGLIPGPAEGWHALVKGIPSFPDPIHFF